MRGCETRLGRPSAHSRHERSKIHLPPWENEVAESLDAANTVGGIGKDFKRSFASFGRHVARVAFCARREE